MSYWGLFAAPLLRSLSAPRARRFQRALDDAQGAQAATLRRLVHAAATTERGRALGLDGSEDFDQFCDKVPLTTYIEILGTIERQRRDPTTALLTPGPVQTYERTSGSGGAVKMIPYNAALLASFRSLFAIWAHDLLSHTLRPRSGRVFVSVSPAFGAAGGFADDRDYLGPLQRLLLQRFVVTPPRGCADLAAFRRELAVALLERPDLELISVWNPSYLLVLMDEIERREPALLTRLPAWSRRVLEREAQPWPMLWPQLQLVSCWTAAAAALPAQELARRLPQARIQGKGLLTTEAPISLPLRDAGGCVPLLDEVVLEFETNDGRCLRLHELDPGASYALIVTQASGLLRYRLGDRVRVSGRYRDTPLLDFIGRADAVSDLVGEKLDEALAVAALSEIASDAGHCLLLPVQPAQGLPHYLCLAERIETALATRVDAALQRGLRYAEARALGQLAPVEAVAIHGLRERVQTYWLNAGLRWGDIKDRALISDLAQAQRLLAALDQRSER
ncbi:MAG: GH3 auxin-responsive promoter family protein [Rhodanobacteraceae bacterium]|nr:GH3 auxin-responsive promoter family protein [Rhodanobacteraceae bacterium]